MLIFLPLRVNTAGEFGGGGGGEGTASVLMVGDVASLTGALTGALTGVLTGTLTGVLTGVLSVTSGLVLPGGTLLMWTLFLLSVFPVGVCTM